ncbi:MAG TPA: glycoside hydrolase family 28 protein [Sunxiuqinia sp.]|nr:glycoside hydrolase family 28 protein [Sunxiuqinia sp.]
MIKLLKRHSYLVLLVAFACSQPQQEVKPIADDVYQGIEFNMPRVVEPTFPDNAVAITEYGAVGDGQTMNTKAIADAIDAVAKKGGGTVNIPRGVWLTGPIILKSNINIHTDAGALVVFSKNKDLYPLVETNFEGLKTVRSMSPIYGKDLENIAITGDGIFDGSGDVWRPVKKSKLTSGQWKDLVKSGGVLNKKEDIWYPSQQYLDAVENADMNVPKNFKSLDDYKEIKDFLRPVMVNIVNCNKVMLDGPTFQNSPAWCLHPYMCQNLTVRNVNVRNPWYSQNGDGIDIESCKNSVVTNCTFDVGDDAICVKSGKGKEARDHGAPTENLIVKNCTVFHGHGGFTVGSEMSGGVKNMHVSDCTFIGTDVGLRFKSTRGRGGIVQGVYISNIDMMDIAANAISFNLYYGGLSVSEMLEQNKQGKTAEAVPPVTEETPQFKDISIKNVTCRGALQAIYLQGLPEMNLKNVTLENLTMDATNGMLCMDADGVTVKNLHLKTKKFPAISLFDSKNVSMDDLYLSDSKEGKTLISVNGKKSEEVKINLMSELKAGKLYELGQKVDGHSIKIARP